VKRTFHLVAGLTGLVILSIAFPIVYTTARGYTAWYIQVSNATFTAKGKRTSGQLHRNPTGTTILITYEVRETGKFRTYLLGLAANKTFVKSCGDWVAAQSALIINRTVPPPCSFPDGSANSAQMTKNYASFVDDFGEKIEAQIFWKSRRQNRVFICVCQDLREGYGPEGREFESLRAHL
jgi:hypothetical protein